MARNGSGTYNRVAGTPYVYNTVIDQAVVNSEFDDIATALTASIAKDGQTTPTADLPMGTYKHTGVGAATARTQYARAAEVQDGSITHLTSVAGTDTITASAALSMTAYVVGQSFEFIPANTNTGATTLNINSIGAGAVQLNGAALASGTIRQNVPVTVKVTATTPVFEIIGNGAFLPRSGGSLVGPLNTARATVASAATTADIWGAAGNEIDWTGTTTCTGFPAAPQAGASRILHLAAAAPFTAGANMLIDGTASGNTITLSANDIVTIHAITTTQFRLEVKKYDGTPVVSNSGQVPIRQTVLYGPVDSNGLPSFGGSTGSTTVTASGTLTLAAANGFGASGSVDKAFQITDPSWAGLSTNGTMYLYVDWNNGTPTTGSTTLAPTYQWGGTYSTTNNQHTFNVQEMTMKVGNGSAATQVYRVFVGEVTVALGVVTAITWYALMGRYLSALTALPAAQTPQAYAHNIGVPGHLLDFSITGQCTSAVAGFSIGDQVPTLSTAANVGGAYGQDILSTITRTSATIVADAQGFQVKAKSNGADYTVTGANFSVYVNVKRRW